MKAVICAHPFKKEREGNDCMIYSCETCKQEWFSGDEPAPQVTIGYVLE